jgi:bacillithiol system protein YtxJ
MKSATITFVLFVGLFLTSFGDSTTGMEKKEWSNLTEIKQLDALFAKDRTRPVLIFKHSTACSISAQIKKDLDKRSIDKLEVDAYYLDILNYRSVSNEIEKRLAIKHESPQVLVVENGIVRYHASHKNINWNAIKKLLN